MADLEPLLQVAPPALSAKVALGLARAKLNRPAPPEPMWKLIAAAILAAGSALLLAFAIIMGPPAGPERQVDVNPWVR